MSDADDTEAVTPIPEAVEAVALPSNDVLPSGNELPIESPQPDEGAKPSSEKIKPPSNASSKHEASNIGRKSKGAGETAEGGKEAKKSSQMERKKLPTCPPPQSRCRARSRDMRQCKKHYREMIGQHEIRNDELEQRETDLRQRLEMLECSMPAVMVWNIWRMAQGAPVSHLRDVVAKQFLEPAAGFPTCPSTPSQHWDCRVREVEAERKQAHHRAVEARQVLAAKDEALKTQKKQIEEAKKLQEERKTQIAKLEDEVKRLRDALKKAQGDENSCETGECGEIQCRQMWLQGKNSISSIHSTDLECLARLQDLAEAELCMKRQIADLERRECAYMRTLQQADEMWAKMETDNASDLASLQDQLDAKIAANQQLADRIVELEDEIEKLHTQLAKATFALQEYKGKTFTDVGLGDVDISTKEKIEQTEREMEGITSIKGSEMGTAKLAEEVITEPATTIKPTEEIDQTKLNLPENSVITAEESVQVKPELNEAETQSMAMKLGPEKETSTEEQSQAPVETVEGTARVEETATVAEIGSRGSMKQMAEQQHGVTGLGQGLKLEAVLSDEIIAATESSLRLLPSPTKDRDIEVAGTGKAAEHSADQKEAIQVAAKPAPTPVFDRVSDTTTKISTEPTREPLGEKTAGTPSKALIQALPVAVSEAILEPTVDTVTRPTVEAKDFEPLITIASQPIKTTSTSSLKPDIEPIPTPPSVPTVEPSQRLTTEPAMEAVQPPPLELTDETGHQRTPEVVVEALAVGPDKHVAKAVESPTDNFAVPIETLVSWHNTVIYAHRQISMCPQCSSASGKIETMLNEMRIFLGEDAPDSAKIECAQGGPVEMFVTVPVKKGPCICKPKTCPLGEISTAAPPQANVQIQTVVDGQSQTSMPVRIPSRESKSSKSSKGPMKSTEEPRLTSIAESTEPDSEIRRAKSIPEAKDVSTVTVGDTASQTEAVRRASSGIKKDEKTCVCPTGVCPKKTAKASGGECIPGIPCSSSKKPQSKEYKSTADAILAPAIKILPNNECRSNSSLVNKTATSNDTTSESGSFACCLCGKPMTPVALKKTISIPIPTNSLFKSKVMPADEGSDTEFLCCACRAKDASSVHSKNSIHSRASEKFTEVGRALHKGKRVAGGIKTSCSHEICCPCSEEGTHAVRKPQKAELNIAKPKVKPETKDVCCLAKISRDKGSKSEAHRRKDKESIKTENPSVSESGSCQMSTSSSSHKAPKTNESSESNVCCSSIEQVVGMMKKKGKVTKCACNAEEGKVNKEGCVCGESNSSKLPNKPNESTKSIKRTPSCVCK